MEQSNQVTNALLHHLFSQLSWKGIWEKSTKQFIFLIATGLFINEAPVDTS